MNKLIQPLELYSGCSKHIRCKCLKCGHIWSITPSNLLKGKGCPECGEQNIGNALRKSRNIFIDEMNKISPNIEIVGEYIHSHCGIECRCKIHNTLFIKPPTNLLRGQTGCKICKGLKISEKLIKSQEDFVDELKNINPEINVVGVYKGSHNRISVECKKCGNRWEPQASSLLSGYGCPCCASSKGEKQIVNYLEQNNVKYERYKKYKDLRGVGGDRHLPLSYDFYLPEYNLLIEYQGQFHDHTAAIQTEDGYKIQVEHDNLKRNYAKENKIQLLEIWYYDFDNIERILDNHLKNPVTTTVA